MSAQTVKPQRAVPLVAVAVAGWLLAGVTVSAGLTASQYQALMGGAVSWYKLDYADAGLANPPEVVDSNRGINGNSYNVNGGTQFSWIPVPVTPFTGLDTRTDGRGLAINQGARLRLGTQGVTNALYQLSGGTTVFTRVKMTDFLDTNGQGVDYFSSFRWGGSAPNSRGVIVRVNPSNHRLYLDWGGTLGWTRLSGTAAVTVPTDEWVDLFWVIDPDAGATGEVRLYMGTGTGLASSTHTTDDYGGQINLNQLAPVTAEFTSLAIGGQNGNAFNGAMEVLAIWDRALTLAEVDGIHTYVPEPSTLALIAFALPLLRRRRA